MWIRFHLEIPEPFYHLRQYVSPNISKLRKSKGPAVELLVQLLTLVEQSGKLVDF